MGKIYFDNAATTSVRKEVFSAMTPYFQDFYGNPSSIYELGTQSKRAVNQARESVAKALDAEAEEIFFTGSGTESNNWAIKGAVMTAGKKKHIITTSIEHHAVLHTCHFLEKLGFSVTYLPVDKFGMISIDDLKKAISPETFIISIMFANNEIGTIQPIKDIGLVAKENGVLFHTDAVQAVGHVPISVRDMNIDMLSLSAHKIHGPKGVGALYIRKGIKIGPILHGGAQERNMRAGTENVPGIVGLGAAIDLAHDDVKEKIDKITKMRDMLIANILEAIPYTKLNGHPKNRLPGNVNISFSYIEGESLILLLNNEGIYVSSGSACTSGSLDPSHVLLATGLSHMEAHGSLRITIGRYNLDEDAKFLMKKLPPIIQRLRDMSPLYDSSMQRIEI